MKKPIPSDQALAAGLRTVEVVASRLTRHRSKREEYISAGLVGLAEAVDRWDGRHALMTYATPRIRGAIHDHIRKQRGRSHPILLTFVDDWEPMQEILAVPQTLSNKDWWDVILQGLSRRQKLTINLLYRAGLSTRETGRVIGITESRVSQMHKSILAWLRGKFGGQQEQLGMTA